MGLKCRLLFGDEYGMDRPDNALAALGVVGAIMVGKSCTLWSGYGYVGYVPFSYSSTFRFLHAFIRPSPFVRRFQK